MGGLYFSFFGERRGDKTFKLRRTHTVFYLYFLKQRCGTENEAHHSGFVDIQGRLSTMYMCYSQSTQFDLDLNAFFKGKKLFSKLIRGKFDSLQKSFCVAGLLVKFESLCFNFLSFISNRKKLYNSREISLRMRPFFQNSISS